MYSLMPDERTAAVVNAASAPPAEVTGKTPRSATARATHILFKARPQNKSTLATFFTAGSAFGAAVSLGRFTPAGCGALAAAEAPMAAGVGLFAPIWLATQK